MLLVSTIHFPGIHINADWKWFSDGVAAAGVRVGPVLRWRCRRGVKPCGQTTPPFGLTTPPPRPRPRHAVWNMFDTAGGAAQAMARRPSPFITGPWPNKAPCRVGSGGVNWSSLARDFFKLRSFRSVWTLPTSGELDLRGYRGNPPRVPHLIRSGHSDEI